MQVPLSTVLFFASIIALGVEGFVDALAYPVAVEVPVPVLVPVNMGGFTFDDKDEEEEEDEADNDHTQPLDSEDEEDVEDMLLVGELSTRGSSSGSCSLSSSH